ncbi:MAG: 3-methyl-2-oxobutanoate hydroxymethyltransferase [Gammaproteobacteria bacterium]
MQHSALSRLMDMKQQGEKIAMLTAYDAALARLLHGAGADALLVGDSLGMIMQGAADTLAVRVSDVVYHVRCVRAGAPDAVVIGDMPFGSFQSSPARAFANAVKLMAAGATMVKIEGGAAFAETVEFLTARGIPVCAHAGLMPQWVRAQGGYKVQGCGEDAAKIRADAEAMQAAGAVFLVLELIPARLAAEISGALRIPTIGIGSGSGCDGQVLVAQDMLGIAAGKKKFVKNFMADGGSIEDAARRYVAAVKSGDFPAPENAF